MAEESRIILPSDTSISILKKEIKQLVKDPRVKRFEELRSEGFDSETAAELSGLIDMSPEVQMETRLRSATAPVPEPIRDAWETASIEVPHAMRNIGSAAGAAVGSAVSSSLLVAANRHGQALGVILGTAITVGVGMAAGRLVHKALGLGWAVTAVLNIISAASIVGKAWIKINK